jgi:hypothetical protein
MRVKIIFYSKEMTQKYRLFVDGLEVDLKKNKKIETIRELMRKISEYKDVNVNAHIDGYHVTRSNNEISISWRECEKKKSVRIVVD